MLNKSAQDQIATEIAEGLVVTTRFDASGKVLSAGAGKQGDIAVKAGEPDLSSYIDHTLLKQNATSEQIMELCAEARQYHFASVCINPTHVRLGAELLRNSGVKVCTVIGFPLGANTTATKVFETLDAIANGATEIDMVINIGALKSGDFTLVAHDIREICQATHAGGALLKVIIETCLLTEEEKVIACLLAKEAGADYVKTSTGFSTNGATPEDVALMRRVVGPELGVKAAGGVRSRADALQMIEAGATRLGASAGVKIVQGETVTSDY
ncbi:MAG: deoxyribose-phosphate aldolase [Chloroflexi bacterium HGW-Chloroflexi-10]|nr:MAG: deoxyribose-phosphate aldolase [Chloroflexi bacterium HGW-Chloroflexi-10]